MLQVYRQKAFERYKGAYRIIQERNGEKLLPYPLCSPIECLCGSTRSAGKVFRKIHSKIDDYGNTDDHQRSKHLHRSRYGKIRAFPIRYRQTQTDTCAVRLPPPHRRRVVLLCKTHVGRVPSRTGQVAHGKGREGGQPMNAAYQTLIVKFSEPITVLDGIFDDAEAWGVDTLKGVDR